MQIPSASPSITASERFHRGRGLSTEPGGSACSITRKPPNSMPDVRLVFFSCSSTPSYSFRLLSASPLIMLYWSVAVSSVFDTCCCSAVEPVISACLCSAVRMSSSACCRACSMAADFSRSSCWRTSAISVSFWTTAPQFGPNVARRAVFSASRAVSRETRPEITGVISFSGNRATEACVSESSRDLAANTSASTSVS